MAFDGELGVEGAPLQRLEHMKPVTEHARQASRRTWRPGPSVQNHDWATRRWP